MKAVVKNIVTEYRDEGSGAVMLLIHGWGDNLHTFDFIVPIISKKWRVVRIDLPGFGASDPLQTPWDVDSYSKFIKDFTDKLNIQVEILVGHSFGGRIAIKAVASKTIKPKKLVLIASAGIAKVRSVRNRFFYILAKAGKVITFIPPFIFWRRQLRKKLYDAAGSDYLKSRELKNTFLKVVKEDLTNFAAEISIPTLLIWGDEDSETPLADGKSFSKIIPGSQLKIIAGAGHFVHKEKPEEVSGLINQFAS